MRTRKVKSAGRFGTGYGSKVRERLIKIESKQHKKQKCRFCKGRAKRISKALWLCKKCGKKFASHTYYIE